METNKSRLKILLIVLGALVIAFGVVFYYFGPYSEAAKGGIKGKPTKSATPTATATPTSTRSATSSPIPTATATPSIATLFSEDFSGNLSQWQVVYDKANISSGQLDLEPLYQTYNSPSDTHAPLIVAGDTAWKDYVYNVKMKTVKQFRPSNPNPWEVGWLIFRYVDAKNFYYFIYKTNGIELGKLVNGTQKFLQTDDNPKLSLNTFYNYKVVVKGNNIRVYINDSQVINYTDSSSPFLSGKIGLYNEDAETLSDNVVVASN